MLHDTRLMSTLKALKIFGWFFAGDPVASSTAEIDADFVHRRLTEMRFLCSCLTQHLAHAFVRNRVETSIEGRFVDHGHESSVSKQTESLPTHVVQWPSRLVVVHTHTALDGNLER